LNNQTVPVTSTLLRNKLATLAQRLQSNVNPSGTNAGYNTLEQNVTESIKILSQFYKSLSEPYYTPTKLIFDTLPDAEGYNNNFLVIGDDLSVIFSEFENLEGVILGEFNYMVSRLNRLNRKLKSVSSQLGDFILFSDLPTKDAIFFADSFNNLIRVEGNSPLLNAEQCEINQVEGIVTLPVDRSKQAKISISEAPVINSNSNGRSGNNEELYAQLHATVSDILDGNSDTWFEYERILTADNGIPLVLDLTINLGEARIINFIRINPNNFGARTQVEILSINTSIDGEDFVSIKDDIPIADFVVEDEANVFTLAPSTSKFAGQGLYTFSPRSAKYIHLTLRQSSSYWIKTSGFEKCRYAIGIRDIEVQAVPYQPVGEVISVNYQVSDDIRKIMLLSNQRPSAGTTSVLSTIDHYISPDNGVTWHQIRPRQSIGIANTTQDIPEILDFNGVDPDSIQTPNPVRSLRYKATLRRDPSAFTAQSSELAQVIADTTELHVPPVTSPFSIKLQNIPVTGTIRLVDPQFGSRGKPEAKYQIATGTGGKLILSLPFKPLKKDLVKVFADGAWTLQEQDPQTIYVDGVAWTRGLLSGDTQRYKLNFDDGSLEFGDGTNGKVVAKGSVVAMMLSGEQIYPSRGYDHIATIDYPTPNDQKQFELYQLYPPTSKTVVLKKGATRHVLEPNLLSYVDPYKMLFSDPSVFGPTARQTFIDGRSEFTPEVSAMWSVDFTNGILYSDNPTSTSIDTTVMFYYYPRERIAEKDWKFVSSASGISDSISLSDKVFKTFTAPSMTVPTGQKYFNLAHKGVVRGTVKFTPADWGMDLTPHEVEYIDGYSELLGVVAAHEALSATSTWTLISAGVYWTPFKIRIVNDPTLAVTFTDQSIFQEKKASIGDVQSGAVGGYFIDYTISPSETGRIVVKLAGPIDNPGSVNYYYLDPRANTEGRYSINYSMGEVFTATLFEEEVLVDYEYTNYVVYYDIARLVPYEDWEFDAKENKLTIKDREILRNIRTPQYTGGSNSGASKFYQIAYQYIKATRGKVSDLEPYFSPVLKDYALKVITKSRLV
jgi:hypothetical protein